MVGPTAVWWSLGNFVSEMGPAVAGFYSSSRTADGLLAHAEFMELPEGRRSVKPTSYSICNDLRDRTVRHAADELARGVADGRIRNELEACLARTRELVPDAR